jgi:hypothetical protein
MTNNDGKEFIIHYLKNDKMPNSMANNIEQILVIEEETEEKTVATLPLVNTQNDKSTQAIRNEEKAIIKSFLNGNTCLTGVLTFIKHHKSKQHLFSKQQY